MMAERVPSVRFASFTEPWEQRKFGEIYQPNNERNVNREFGYDKTLSIATMTFNGGNGASDDSLDTYKVIRVGDIAFEGHTNKEHAYGRFVLNDAGDGLMSPRFACLRPIVEQHYSFWKYYIPRERTMRPVLVNATKSGTMMNELVVDDLMEESVLVPDLAEQEAIGLLFSHLDSLITLHQREHDRLLNVRSSLMQKMFPKVDEVAPSLRFSDYSEPWAAHKLGDLVTRYDQRVPTPTDDYVRLGVRSFARGTFLEKVSADQAIGETELRKVGVDNLIVNIVFAWEQAIAITSSEDTVALVSHRFPQFSFNEGQCPDFYRYALLDPRFKHHLWLASPSGAGRNKTLRIDEMLGYELLVPTEAEQRTIAAFFKNLDQSIETRQRECDALAHVKSALLQKMFV